MSFLTQREYDKRYRERHPELCRERKRRWRQANPDKALASVRRYQKKHPEKNLEAVRRYQKKHPEVGRQCTTTRRARIRGADGTHTLKEWLELVEQHGFACVYCGCTDRPLTRDHVIPLSKGGSNWISNIAPACKSCNCRKGNKL